MNTVWVVQSSMKADEFVSSVQHGLRAHHLVFPVPPRMLSKHRDEVVKTLMDGPEAEGIAFMTSGTVGDSKLVVRSAASIAIEAVGVAQALDLSAYSKVLITTPITHSYGFGILMACWEVGARVWVAVDDNIFTRLIYIRKLMQQHRFNVVTGVPFIFRNILRQVLDLKPPDVSLAGGERVPLELMTRWEQEIGSPLRQEYGLSEAGIVTIAKAADPLGSIGRPVQDCAVQIIKATGELIVLRAGSPTSYFLGENSGTFTAHGGIRTGDLGYKKDGSLYLTSRKDSVVFIEGMNVVPEEVEQVLLASDEVDECVVVGRRKKDGSTELVANVVPPLYSLIMADLQAYMRENLDPHKIPRIVGWSNLPRTASGKVDRSAL